MKIRPLRGMVVAITGASAGIGRALAAELAPHGVKLVLTARRKHRLLKLDRELGGGHLCIEADVSIPEDCRRIIDETINHFGRLDTLVCNAGYGIIRPAAETTADELRQIFATNVLGTTECIRAAVPHMLRQEVVSGVRGQIMIVSSAVARRGLPYFGAYSATKAAQISLAEAMRVELRDQKIAVTSVLPVGTGTEFFRAAIRLSGVMPPTRSAIEVRQTPLHVAIAMVNAIRKPSPEIWPARWYRWLLSLATFCPGTTDRFLSGRLHSGPSISSAALPAILPVMNEEGAA